MQIGFDGSRAFGKNKTGTENYSYQLLKALTKIDQKNKYIIYDKKTIPLPWLWTQVGLASRTFLDPLDVLFVPAHTLPLIRKPGLKTVVTVHDLGSEYLPSSHQLKQRLYLSLMQKYQLKTASKIIAVSKATKLDLISRIGIPENKISVIYEGYNKELFHYDTQDNSLRYFLFVGTVQPRKNLERVIKAFAKVNKHKLLIAGSKGWLSDEIYALPRMLGIEDRVKFLGYVPDKNLSVLYKGAIALVFPSLFEGFGLPILEAQACGCPVITSSISSMPEVAGPPAGGGAILVDPYSVETIEDAMIRVQATGVRQQVIKKGLENIKRFSWEKCAKETLEVLESV